MMKSVKVSVQQQDSDFHFRGTNAVGHTVDVDDYTGYESGIGSGVSPMELLVIAIGACSGVDVADILKKGKETVNSFDMDIEGLKPAGTSPSVFESIHVSFRLTGELTEKKVRRAIELSLGKYCSVSRTLEHTATITYDFSINGESFPVKDRMPD